MSSIWKPLTLERRGFNILLGGFSGHISGYAGRNYILGYIIVPAVHNDLEYSDVRVMKIISIIMYTYTSNKQKLTI